jgi:hypothetical protein
MELVLAHPLPTGIERDAFSSKWADELGRLYGLHSKSSPRGKFFIGIACTLAFAGEQKGSYDNPDNVPTFPLVAPGEVRDLDDLYKWEIPEGTRRREVSFHDAYNRIELLGGKVHKPSGSSHYQVRFDGARTWPLDRNIDPVPDRFLKQLEPITGQNLETIKYVLVSGEWPKRVPKI